MAEVNSRPKPDLCWVVYVLVSTPRPMRTYCGSTNNLAKRLRQHNGELVGGAVATKTDRPWTLAALVTGFGTGPEAKSACLRFEWFSKVGHCPKPLLHGIRTGPERRSFLLQRAATLLRAPLPLKIEYFCPSMRPAPAVETDGLPICL